jgi:hypothetical protein
MAVGLYQETKSWNVFVDSILSTWFISASASRNVEVTWDPARTRIVSARVRAVVDVNTIAIGWSVSFNRSKVIDTPWAPAHAEKDADVTGLLINGLNTVTIELGKMYPWIGEAKGRFTVTLDVTFEGEEPSVSPPTTKFPWEAYAKNAIVGAAVGGVALSAYGVIVEGAKLEVLRDYGSRGVVLGAVGGLVATFFVVGTGGTA